MGYLSSYFIYYLLTFQWVDRPGEPVNRRERNKINQIKPASGPRSSDIKKGRFRAALDVTSGSWPKIHRQPLYVVFGPAPHTTTYSGGFAGSSWIHRGKPRKRIHSFKNKSYRRAKTSTFLWDSCYTSI